MSSFRLNELERHPAKPRRGSGAGGRNQKALARLHSVGSLNRSHDFTAEGGGSFAAPTGHPLSTAAVNLDLVDSVWADGPELAEIIKNFEGVPKRFNRHYDHDQTMKWFGDDARFIVANWT